MKNETYAQKFKIELVPMDAESQAKETICVSYDLDNNHFDLLRMSVIFVLENSNFIFNTNQALRKNIKTS